MGEQRYVPWEHSNGVCYGNKVVTCYVAGVCNGSCNAQDRCISCAKSHTFGVPTPQPGGSQPRISSWKSFHSLPWRSQYWRRVRPLFSPSKTSPKVATMVSSPSRQCRKDMSLNCTRLPWAYSTSSWSTEKPSVFFLLLLRWKSGK